MLKVIFSGFLTAFIVNSAFCQERAEFNDVDAFVKSLKEASVRIYADGDLIGKGRKDWAGGIVSKDENGEENIQLYILEKLASGKYSVAEQSASRQAFGGTGNFGYEELKIADRSLFVVFSYQWHACAGNATSQFKLRKNNWQMIGVESFELNHSDGSGIEVSSSTNLVTGNALVKRERNGKLNVSRFKVQPKLFLFKNYNGEGSISMHEKKRLC